MEKIDVEQLKKENEESHLELKKLTKETKFDKILKEARNQFIRRKITELCSALWITNPNQIPKIKIADLQDLKNQIEECNRRRKYKNYFITITTPPKTDKLKFIDGCKKLLDNAVIDRGYMVFEQRGESVDTVGDGIHCHMLVFRAKYNHSKFYKRLLNQLIKLEINETYKSVEQLLKISNLPHGTFSFQNIKDETVKKKLAYIQGDKNNEKLLKVQFDAVFRKKYNLQDIYKKNI